MADGSRRSPQRTARSIESIPSPRGLIYDRNGRPLVTNVATFAVQTPTGRPDGRPACRRSSPGSRRSSKIPTADINTTIDSNPGSNFDLVRIAGDVDRATRHELISESSGDLPGVEVAVESRRQYPEGRCVSQLLGYTGPISATSDARSEPAAICPTT